MFSDLLIKASNILIYVKHVKHGKRQIPVRRTMSRIFCLEIIKKRFNPIIRMKKKCCVSFLFVMLCN